MTRSEDEALAAMVAHHRALEHGVATRVEDLRRQVATGGPTAGALADLVAYLEAEVLAHALAEEQTIYPAAAGAGLAETVAAMTSEHRVLAEAIGELAGSEPPESAEAAGRVAAIFEGHVARENEVVLPHLLAHPATDLAALLVDMHAALTAPRRAPGRPLDAAV